MFTLGGDELGKKMLATSIDEDTLRQFRSACALRDKKMNSVLEDLMQRYSEEVAKEKAE
jgi:hypothetical protein